MSSKDSGGGGGGGRGGRDNASMQRTFENFEDFDVVVDESLLAMSFNALHITISTKVS